MKLRHLIFSSIVVLLGTFAVAQTPQGNVWDIALDRYELICNECIDLKERIAAGETVTRQEAEVVISELSKLRIQLSGENGQMSAAQRARFQYIGCCFGQGRKTSDLEPAIVPGGIVPDMPEPVAAELAVTENPTASPDTSITMRQEPDSGLEPASSGEKTDGRRANRRNRVSVMLLSGFNPFSFGGIVIDKPGYFGVYAKALSNLRSFSSEYSCNSDGTTFLPDGTEGRFWASSGSDTRRAYASAVAGLVYSPACFVSVRLGVGYGWDKYFWRDSEGNSVLVRDLGREGLSADAGVDFSWKMLSVGVGVETLSFKTATPYFGIGVNF